jgi:hypothetical protein
METEEVIREVPVTVQRPVTERITVQIPVETIRWEEEEQVRHVPYTVQRSRVSGSCRAESGAGLPLCERDKGGAVPRTVPKWVAYTSTRMVPRTVTMRVPLNGSYDGVVYEGPTTSYFAPLSAPPVTSVRRVELKKEPTPAAPKPEADDLVPAEGAKSGEAADEAGQTPSAAQEEADKKPMLPTEPAKGANGDSGAAADGEGGPDLGNAVGDKGA